MRCLLDTHAFLWWIAGDPRLSATAKAAIGSVTNEVFLSAVSAWEIALLVQLGRLNLVDAPADFVPRHLQRSGIAVLPVQLRHALEIGTLPLLHRDPFDRMLVTQARVEGLSLVTRDVAIAQYEVPIIW